MCTRVIYKGGDDRFTTSRSMDWETNISTSLWIFPKGMSRDGGIDENSIKWVSLYGSIITSGFDCATADGMNEKGLVANLLWLSEADFGESDKPTLSVGALAQYVLDNYANVNETVEGLRKNDFQLIASALPHNEGVPKVHLVVSDAVGDSAILEYIDGALFIHHSKDYKVATNSPAYDQQLSINSYWQDIGGEAMLPGTHRSADRFARASFYTDSTDVRTFDNERMVISTAIGISRDASVPFSTNENVAATLWRTIADQKALKYYFDSAVSPSIFWVDIHKLDLKEGAEVKVLDLKEYPMYAGEVSDKFKESTPFKWLNEFTFDQLG
jgi:penicillin V acylase-like amidase (Ntn superfamily)